MTLDSETDLSVVFQAESAESALDADFSALDLVIADVSLPGMSGLELTAKHLAALYPSLPVLVVAPRRGPVRRAGVAGGGQGATR